MTMLYLTTTLLGVVSFNWPQEVVTNANDRRGKTRRNSPTRLWRTQSPLYEVYFIITIIIIRSFVRLILPFIEFVFVSFISFCFFPVWIWFVSAIFVYLSVVVLRLNGFWLSVYYVWGFHRYICFDKLMDCRLKPKELYFITWKF